MVNMEAMDYNYSPGQERATSGAPPPPSCQDDATAISGQSRGDHHLAHHLQGGPHSPSRGPGRAARSPRAQ